MESNCNVDIFVEVAHISEGIFGDDIFTDDICEEVVNIRRHLW